MAYALGNGIESKIKRIGLFSSVQLIEVEHFYGFSGGRKSTSCEHYREYFSEKGLYENEAYKGFGKYCLLKQADKKLIVATSKPEKNFLTQILNILDL